MYVYIALKPTVAGLWFAVLIPCLEQPHNKAEFSSSFWALEFLYMYLCSVQQSWAHATTVTLPRQNSIWTPRGKTKYFIVSQKPSYLVVCCNVKQLPHTQLFSLVLFWEIKWLILVNLKNQALKIPFKKNTLHTLKFYSKTSIS